KMRDLISEKIAQASTKRTAPMVAEASGTPDFKPEPMVVTKAEAKPGPKAVAKAEPKPEPKPEPMVVTKPEPKVAAAKVEPKEEPKAEAKAESRFAVASATSLPPRRAGRARGDAIGTGRGGDPAASARRCRLDRANPTGAGQDADGQGRRADRIARAVARCCAGCRTSACRGRGAGAHASGRCEA